MTDYGFGSCKQCGNTYKMVRKWKEFCSQTCKNRWHNERRNRAIRMLEAQEKQEKDNG